MDWKKIPETDLLRSVFHRSRFQTSPELTWSKLLPESKLLLQVGAAAASVAGTSESCWMLAWLLLLVFSCPRRKREIGNAGRGLLFSSAKSAHWSCRCWSCSPVAARRKRRTSEGRRREGNDGRGEEEGETPARRLSPVALLAELLAGRRSCWSDGRGGGGEERR
ncbi:hypothetical protein H5410_017062 [Solanum commersonii]|uniref:Uncharacterized protein n=1 Tax=Solanum commersonii TaxID=4109 RepID=A0A9J5ZY21_SOLCO|nr:hypothetical protein H5410_017062 [Solanum commersonii]